MRSAAGSSGGSAVALACGMAPLASGSDTGGSPAQSGGLCRHRRHASLLRPGGERTARLRLVQSVDRRPDGAQRRRCRADAVGDGERRCPRSARLHAAGRAGARPPRALVARRVPPMLGKLRVAFTEDFGFAPTEQAIRRVFRDRVTRLVAVVRRMPRRAPDCTRCRRRLCGAARRPVPGDARQELPRAAGDAGPECPRQCRGRAELQPRRTTRAPPATQTRIYRAFQQLLRQLRRPDQPDDHAQSAAVDRALSGRDRRRSRRDPISTGWRSPMASRWPAIPRSAFRSASTKPACRSACRSSARAAAMPSCSPLPPALEAAFAGDAAIAPSGA